MGKEGTKMPIYEYECQDCHHVTEFRESMSATSDHVCGKCGSRKTAKIMSSFSASVAAPKASAPACAHGGGCASGKCPYA